MNGTPNQPPAILHYILGYNLLVDRFAIMRLLNGISEATNRGAQTITLCISSPGGDPAQAFYAYEMLKNYPVPIITHNVGSVHSAAIPIFLAGSRRRAVPQTGGAGWKRLYPYGDGFPFLHFPVPRHV